MRRIVLILIFFFLLSGTSQAGKYFGVFGTATEVDDTCRLCFSTFDTLGHSANPHGDSNYVLRFIRGTLLDSTAATELRSYLWCITKKAYDGTNLGQYSVFFYWRPCAGKWYNDDGFYVVEAETVQYARGDTSIKQNDPDLYKASVVKINGGYAGECTTVVNEVRVVSTDTMKADVLDKTGYSLTDGYMTKADSSLYMRTDWANIKNVSIYQNFSQTRLHFVDSLGEELSLSSVDSVRKVYIVDSLDQPVTAEVDTSQIKTMNENNLWGASHIWNYQTRTLTSGVGAGANSVVIRCKQSSDSSNIALAQIQVTDSLENSTIGLLTSDSQGRGFFALDNGTYCVRMYKPGWQFTIPETLQVSGDEDTTYYGDLFDPGSPPGASLCRVYGWIYDINNQPVVGAKIEASIKTVPLRYLSIIISPYYKTTTTDDEGYWYLDLYPNSAISPSDTKYIFFIYSPSGTILRIETTVPDQASWELQW